MYRFERKRKKKKRRKEGTKQITDLQWEKKFFFSPPRLPIRFVPELISSNKFDVIKKTRGKIKVKRKKEWSKKKRSNFIAPLSSSCMPA